MLDEAIQKEIIQKGRDFLKSPLERDPFEEAFESDQDRKLPQPPLAKAPMAEESGRVALTRDFSGLALKNDLVSLIRDRRSARIYTGETMTLDELSFLLWATQGIKKIRGRAYATIRTVPCGGARHEFETYLIVRNVVGLRPGAYHYLPMLHALYNAVEQDGQLSFEERMGCGFGACMGCSCKTKYGYKRICKEGPVLTKDEIIW